MRTVFEAAGGIDSLRSLAAAWQIPIGAAVTGGLASTQLAYYARWWTFQRFASSLIFAGYR
jgi:hypothetical protein